MLDGAQAGDDRPRMLLPAAVIPFLLHPDADVRDHALTYLADSHDPAPATADDLWAATDRYGDEPDRYAANERARFLSKLTRFPATPRSTERLLEALRTGVPDLGVPLVRAAAELPSATLGVALADEAIRARLPASTLAELEDDLRLSAMGFDALWAELLGVAADAEGTWEVHSPVHRRACRLVRALTRFPEQASARGLEILGGPVPRDPAGENLQTFVVDLFGRVRYTGPLDPLCRILGEEGDYSNERAADALVRVGTPDVVATVARLASGAHSTEAFRTWAPCVIARIRCPESEAALVRMLAAEDDLFGRTELAMSLLELCATSPDALGLIEEMVVDGDYDSQLLELDELLVTVGQMVDWSPRDPAAWAAKPKLVPPGLAAKLGLERWGEREVKRALVAVSPAVPPARRGFVPYGKKAQRKKRKQGR